MKLNDMIGSPILDIPCPQCNQENTYQVDTDETEFSYDGSGHYYVDYFCSDCGKTFRVYFEFKYKITNAYY